MKLNINNIYLVNTKKGTLKNKKLMVIGVLNWRQAAMIPTGLNILQLAIDENVLNDYTVSIDSLRKDAETDNKNDKLAYFKSLSYYHCIDVDSENSDSKTSIRDIIQNNYNPDRFKHYVIWDEIIDIESITVVDTIYKFEAYVKIKNKLNKSIDMVLTEIKNLIARESDDAIDVSFRYIKAGEQTIEEKLKLTQSELDKANEIIRQLNKLKSIEPIINSLADSNLTEKVNEIEFKMGLIHETVVNIDSRIN